MSDIPALLLASLNPETRKPAEQSLSALSAQQGFIPHLVQLFLDTTQDRAVRLSASVYLKNLVKLRWEEDVQALPENDKIALRNQLVPTMLGLSAPSDRAIRVQVAESVSLIAELDFPTKWTDLIDQLVASLSPNNYSANIGVLETAHSIFKPWRSLVRSDRLYEEINFVLSRFMTPFLQLFRQTATLLLNLSQSAPSSASDYALYAQAMVLLVAIYYDFTCQDLPPAIEDSQPEFFAPSTGLFQAFLAWDPQALKGEPDDATPSTPSQIKTGILEIAELFVKLYPEQLQDLTVVQAFVQAVWNLVGNDRLPSIGDDALVSQSLRFLSTAIRSGYYKSLFSSKEVINSLVQAVVIPNVALREHEAEQFEDDPLEYIRVDLAVSSTGTDLATRRQAAGDVLQALVSSGYEAEATDIVGAWINTGLSQYNSNPQEQWKAKDSAIYLLASVATRGSTSQHGVTSTNALVDVVKFFSEHIFQDLQAEPGTVHPILQVDAIRFLQTFRNQLTKPQLLSVLPLLAKHLSSDNYVAYTYAAITIDKVLAIRVNNQLLFSQGDIQGSAAPLIDALLKKVESARTAEKVAENDHLMKCVMRIIVTAKQALVPSYERILNRLAAILSVTLKNPSNPMFDQWLFEGTSALVRFIVSAAPATLPTFEQQLFPIFTTILQQDVDQYIPYVFQILAQLLELHAGQPVPAEYRGLVHLLLTPAVWQQKGSIPGLVRLLKAFLRQDAVHMAANGQVAPILAVVQQRLVPSKTNDVWGFELIQAVFANVDPAVVDGFAKPLFITLLTRMQSTKTSEYVYYFSRFILYALAIQVKGLGPDFLIKAFEGIQPGLWTQVLSNFVVPEAPKLQPKDRKLAAVGLTRLLCESSAMMQQPFVSAWPTAYNALRVIFKDRQHFKDGKEEGSQALSAIDVEEQTAGYQAAFSRLAASETVEQDPVAYAGNVIDYVSASFQRLGQQYGSQVTGLVSAAGGPLL